MLGMKKDDPTGHYRAMIQDYRDQIERLLEEISKKNTRIEQLEERLMAVLNPTAHRNINLSSRVGQEPQAAQVSRIVPVSRGITRPPELTNPVPRTASTPKPPA